MVSEDFSPLSSRSRVLEQLAGSYILICRPQSGSENQGLTWAFETSKVHPTPTLNDTFTNKATSLNPSNLIRVPLSGD